MATTEQPAPFAVPLDQVVPFANDLISHFVATRPYRIAFEREHTRRLVRFGWPLLLNGLLVTGVCVALVHLIDEDAGTLGDLASPGLLAIATPGPFFFMGDVPEEIQQATAQMQLGAEFSSHAAGFDR